MHIKTWKICFIKVIHFQGDQVTESFRAGLE